MSHSKGDTRRVGHLTLLKQPKKLTSREFNALPFAERLEMVQQAAGRRKYDLIIDAADARELVACLPMQEVYLLARELGPEDMTELLALATTEQLTGILDLDCWQRDRLDGKRALEWLAALAEAGDEALLDFVMEMEFELLAALVSGWIQITWTPDDIEDEEERKALIARDGGYGIEYRDSETAKLVGHILSLIWQRDPEFYWRLMATVHGEGGSVLEEDVYRWRTGRLLDLGFPEPVEAQSVYAWQDPDRADPSAWNRDYPLAFNEETRPPGYLLTRVAPGELLSEVLTGGISSDSAWELTYLLNKMMVADEVDPGDARQVDETLRRLYATLNLALEHLAGQNVERAAQLFNGCYLEFLFRHGHSLVLQLARRAHKIQASRIAPYIDVPYRALLEALCRRRPDVWEGAIEAGRGGSRPFARLSEIRQVADCLDRLELQQQLFDQVLPFDLPTPAELDLSGCQIDEADQVGLSTFFLTALANQLLGNDFVPNPVSALELPDLHRLVSRDGKVDPDLRQRLVERFEAELPGSSAFVEWSLGTLEEEFCCLDARAIDGRFLACLLVRLNGTGEN
ncbi:MAG: hypothetical protein Tsb0017_01290 [Geothermobacteraceae bacterium]